MGNLVFQATSGGQITLSGTNTASNYTIAVPAITGTFVTTGDTGTVTNTMLANSSTTINGTAIALGASGTVTAAAGTLTGTTLASNVVSSSLTSVGTIATGVWNGTIITGTYGGTGINNGSNTISIAGNVSYTGAFARTVAVTAATSVTLPTSGTIISSVTALPGAVTGTPSSTSYLRGDGTWATLSSNSISNGTSNVTVNTSGGTVTVATAGNTAATFDTSGNLILAGTTASSWTSNGSLTLGGSGGSYGVTIYNGTNSGGLYFASALSGGGRHAGSITYNGTSNAMLFETNSNGTVATLDTSGNLGLGVTPSAWRTATKGFQIGANGSIWANTGNNAIAITSNSYVNSSGNDAYITSSFASEYLQFNGTHAWNVAPSGTANTAITFTQAMTLDNSGYLYLGTTTNAGNFIFNAVQTNSTNGILVKANEAIAGSGNMLSLNSNTSNNYTLAFGISDTNNYTYLTSLKQGTGASGQMRFYSYTTLNGYYNTSGNWYKGDNTISWSITSDVRIKENIVDVANGLDIIKALRPVEFDYKKNKKHEIGFIAQEYEQVLPSQVYEDTATEEDAQYVEDGKVKVISQNLTPYLVKAIQELSAEVNALKAKLGV